jgi:hypothetical protein
MTLPREMLPKSTVRSDSDSEHQVALLVDFIGAKDQRPVASERRVQLRQPVQVVKREDNHIEGLHISARTLSDFC